MNDDADAKIGDMIARLQATPKVLAALPDKLAPVVKTYLLESYRQGTDPDGEPWTPTKTGQVPDIKGSSLAVVAIGKRVIVKLRWHDALHSKGKARGRVQRRMVPDGAVPPKLAERMQAIVRAELGRVLKGGA